MVEGGPRAKIQAGARTMPKGVVIVMANDDLLPISALTMKPILTRDKMEGRDLCRNFPRRDINTCFHDHA